MRKQVDKDDLTTALTSDLDTASGTTASISSRTIAEPTTNFMLGNIPYRATQKDITAALDHMGFEGTYLFCHVPNANKRKPRATNLGYAFIGFANSSSATAFVDSFSTFRFLNITTEKQFTLKPAHFQGH